ncbi:mechanosensitive ion channel domain-containing protein [uncultured Faecalicoccus sp.]|uniref:mechanosensitive ion channel family protein n=1 Tax=uncultured Faecalicoccus sp. TaxID=1971760 RepID=UPI0026289C6A|nr:mechanosensitive ion channel domain-containing protein [uncultured Faecalicoccus sp.]
MFSLANLENLLIKLAVAALIILFGVLLAKVIKKFILRLSKNVTDHGSLSFIGSCASIVIKIIFIAIALTVLGLDMSVIVGSLSAVSLGISLALRDTMNDVAGGIQILFTKPFVIGDYLRIEDKEGTVVRIEVMYIVLQTFDHQEIIIPNSTAISEIVVNYSKEKYRRIHISFSAPLDFDVEQCLQLGKSVIDAQEKIVESMQKEVVVDAIKERTMEVGLYCFVPFEEYWTCLCSMNEMLVKKRKEMGMEPISQMVYIKSDGER